MKIYTAAEAAGILGCDKSTVLKHCRNHGIGTKHGVAVVLTDKDIETLKSLVRTSRGNPNFGPGYHDKGGK